MSITYSNEKRVALVCAGCGEKWEYVKPLGKRGPNPVTDPSHNECRKKHNNRNRARSRAHSRAGETYEPWNPRVHVLDPVDLDSAELEARSDALDDTWWRSSISLGEMEESGFKWTPDQAEDDENRPKDDRGGIQYSSEADKEAVELWTKQNAVAVTAIDAGRTTRDRHPIIGSARPWNEAGRGRELLCTRGLEDLMESFTMDL